MQKDKKQREWTAVPVVRLKAFPDREIMADDNELQPASSSGSDKCDWANLLPEALADIFSRLPLKERLRVVTRVCTRWRKASCDPACWTVVDMDPWFHSKTEEDYWWEFECEPEVDALVKVVVERSQGQLRELRTTHVTDVAIEFIAERCPSLIVLCIPNSLMVTNRSALNLASKCPKLQQLDVSDCYNISMSALEAFGRNCEFLMWLGRNMTQRSNSQTHRASGQASPGGDEEAIVMSKHMGRLKHLEMKKTSLSDLGLRHLTLGCPQLENLNLACCTSLSPKALDDVTRKCFNLKSFTKPITPRMHINPDFQLVLFA